MEAATQEAIGAAANGLTSGSGAWLFILALGIIGASSVGLIWAWRSGERRRADPTLSDLAEIQRQSVKLLGTLEDRTAKIQEILAETRMMLDVIERRMEQHSRDADAKLTEIFSRCLAHGVASKR